MAAPAIPGLSQPTVVCVAGRHVLDVMAAMGIKTILLDDEIPWEVACAVDLPVEVDLADWPACEHVLRRLLTRSGLSVDAVVSLRDSHVPLAGFLAARLGTRGMSVHAALNCNDKARMRQALDGAGLPNPRFALALEPKEAERLGESVGFPLVLKRTKGAGGGAVRLCPDPPALTKAIADLTATAGPVELLAEEYLTGPEYAIQTVTQAGVTEILSVLRAQIGPAPRFAETGYDYPAGLPPEQDAELGDLVRAALAAVGLDHGVAHVQVRYTGDGPRIVEINPRPPGGVLAHVTSVVSGVDMVRAGVEAALGVPLTRSAPLASQVLYRCVVFDQPGYLGYETGALSEFPRAGALDPIVEIDADPGDLVLAVDHPDGGVYGRVVLFGDDDADLPSQYRAVMSRLRPRILQARQETTMLQKELPNVLVLSGRRSVENLKMAGYRVGLASQSIPFDLTLTADTPIEVDFDDWPQVLAQVERIHQQTPFDAVITQLERLLPLAGQIRARLGLEGGISEQAALDCMDKPTTQRLLADAGLPVARFRRVTSAEEAKEAAAELGLPVIVKPPAASSGAGLSLCESADEAMAAAADLIAAGHDGALMEEFLRGTEIGLFAYRLAGQTEVITCLKADVGPPPKFVKLGGDYPGDLDPQIVAEVSALTGRALAAVGLDNWIATVQMMLTADGPRVMEINPRVPGGQTVELVAATTGYEPTLVAAEVALGRRPSPTVARTPFAWYRCLVFDQAGHLFYNADAEDEVPGLETQVPPVIELDVEPGEVVLPMNHPRGGVFGRIMIRGTSPAALERDYARIIAALDLRLEPLSDAEHEAIWRPHTRCC